MHLFVRAETTLHHCRLPPAPSPVCLVFFLVALDFSVRPQLSCGFIRPESSFQASAQLQSGLYASRVLVPVSGARAAVVPEGTFNLLWPGARTHIRARPECELACEWCRGEITIIYAIGSGKMHKSVIFPPKD